MKIVIVGAGMVGYSLAEHFAGLDHNITVIERDRALCDEINSKLDIFVVQGMGSSPAALAEAGIGSADLVIAVKPEAWKTFFRLMKSDRWLDESRS